MRWLHRLLHCAVFAILTLSLVVGCSRGPNRPKTYPVSGTVTLNGQPLEGASVIFVPKAIATGAAAQATSPGPQPATGETDAQGRYVLGTFAKGDGVIPGEYLVKVFKFEKPAIAPGDSATVEEEEEEYVPPEDEEEAPPPSKNLLPERYANEQTSGLSFTVEAKANTFDIALTQ